MPRTGILFPLPRTRHPITNHVLSGCPLFLTGLSPSLELKHAVCAVLAVAALSLFFACSSEKLDLTVKVRMDGKPVDRARVMVDNEEQGFTGADGVFAGILKKKPGAVVEIVVLKELPGYRIKPWKTTFLMKQPVSGTVGVSAVDADLRALQYITIAAMDKNGPLQNAVVEADGTVAGKTDARGLFEYEYKDLPKEGPDLRVTKPGYAAWAGTGPVEPGQRIEALLTKRVTVTISALMDDYGQASGIPGITVTINNKDAGTTDADGVFLYTYEGEQGGNVPLLLSAPGYIPETWKTSLVPEEDVSVRRYFLPVAPRPIRTGIHHFAGNTPNAELSDVLARTEAAVAAQLFKHACFREVPSGTLRSGIKHANLHIEAITETGWIGTPLKKTVDMIVLGSVSREDGGFLIETRFFTAGGTMILGRITRVKSAGDINSAARDIANAALERFPFEGAIVSVDGGRIRLNLGKAGYRIAKGADFTLMRPRLDEQGRVLGFLETGRLQVITTDERGSWAEIANLNEGEKVSAGDRTVRRFSREDEEEGARNYFMLSARGGMPPDVSPLAGVNVYVNDEWTGTTGRDGSAEVPLPIEKDFTLLLYRHGYQHVTAAINIEKNKDTRVFTLPANTSLFRIDSDPRSAAVSVDGVKIGRTPILAGKPVPLGFHSVKVSLGGDYRDWEEVVEFSKKEENRINGTTIILHKDYLRIGEQAERKGDLHAAIQSYRNAGKGHPDFSAAHHRLARIYLDDLGEYDKAIREFESVLLAPENLHGLYQQFSEVYLSLGRAYYEKGAVLAQTGQRTAAKDFRKAIQNLGAAKRQMRFFPNDHAGVDAHDIYYYTALSYHHLYRTTGKNDALNSANLAWREYFEFFPRSLEGDSAYELARETARKYWDQLKKR